MSLWSMLIAAVVAIAVLIAGAFLVAGPERIWAMAGPADLGPVAFGTLRRRSSPNDALACPPNICNAESEQTPPVFAMSALALRQAFANAVAAEPRLEKVASDEGALTDRYVQRSRLMGFPDTIIVQFFDLGEGRSTLALYSRSQIGESDFGVNRARIERWLRKLAEKAPAIEAA